MEIKEYQIGKGVDSNTGNPLWVGYRPVGPEWAPGESICVQTGVGPGAEGPICAPKDMLAYRPYIFPVVEGVIQNTGFQLAPPGWFELKCQEANCQWFIPMVKRMAAGNPVPLQEILAAYLKHNQQPAPCGKWSQLFRG